MTRGRWIGHGLVLAGAIAVVVGALGRWVGEVAGLRESEFVTSNERAATVGMGVVVALIAVAALVVRARTGRGLGSVQLIAWLVLLIVAGISALDVRAKVDSLEVMWAEPGHDPHPGRVGWGWWSVVGGVVIALVGLIVAYREVSQARKP